MVFLMFAPQKAGKVLFCVWLWEAGSTGALVCPALAMGHGVPGPIYCLPASRTLTLFDSFLLTSSDFPSSCHFPAFCFL